MVDDYVEVAMSNFDGKNKDSLTSLESYIEDRMYDYEHKQ